MLNKIATKVIHLFDVQNGRPIGEGIKHSMEVLELSLNQSTMGVGRQIVVVDKNREMFISGIAKTMWKKLGKWPISSNLLLNIALSHRFSLGNMVETFAWNSDVDMLVAIMDSKFVVWYYPNVVFVDEDIAPLTRFEKDGRCCLDHAKIVRLFQCT